MLDRVKNHPDHLGELVGELLIVSAVGGAALWISLRLGGVLGCVGWIVAAGCVAATVVAFAEWLEKTRPTTLADLLEEWRLRAERDDATRRAMSHDGVEERDDDHASPFLSEDDDASRRWAEGITDRRGPQTYRYMVRRYESRPFGIVPRGEFIEYVVADSLYEAERTMRRRYPHPSQVFHQGSGVD
jgi:hypothetical protein